MFSYLSSKLFGSPNQRLIKSLKPLVDQINSFELELEKLTDNDLQVKTNHFKGRIIKGESLDSVLPEAFAVVREASKRVMGKRHFDVQIIGGIIMHRGMIAEMKTGEGKTLAATLPAYLNALTGKGVHVVTVNDYLASRDADWMGQIYTFLGLTVGCLAKKGIDKKVAYNADITYGTNNEFGFDYLRDHLKFKKEDLTQREFNFAIVDEVDSILIDEARTPLIISGPTEDNSKLYSEIDKIIPKLIPGDYEIDEKARTAVFTDQGHDRLEDLLLNARLLGDGTGLYDIENMQVIHHLNQALKAHKLFHKDVDYIIQERELFIVDEFTGRIMHGRRYSEGLHQALEAKEGLTIQNENQTLASITFQNYFRLYPKLSGMTGTAITEANEFADIYKLGVVEVPPNITVSRIDEDDEIYKTNKEKYDAIIEEIKKAHSAGQPILVGTVSIEKSEQISSVLKKHKIKHNVLNARYHAEEAAIIAQAGRIGAITIATNMAGRGTDIMLGGNAEMLISDELQALDGEIDLQDLRERVEKQVSEEKQKMLSLGGLFIIGTERHESRRIDNQLRGRAGRQGDPGRTKFFLSLEDDLMRIFGSDRMSYVLTKLGLKDGEAIVHPWISKSLEKAQQKVEARNYDMRKNLLRFDNVMNEQRKVIYSQRLSIMFASDLTDAIDEMILTINQDLVGNHIPRKSYIEEWDLEGLKKEIYRVYNLHLDIPEYARKEGVTEVEILEYINHNVKPMMDLKLSGGVDNDYSIINMVKYVFITTLDQLWKDHLHSLDYLRAGINLRGYAQKDPLNEYKMEAFNLFQTMLTAFGEQVIQRIASMNLEYGHLGYTIDTDHIIGNQKIFESRLDPALGLDLGSDESEMIDTSDSKKPLRNYVGDADPNDQSTWGKVSRNQSCPCGSGKKYKHCHGAME